MRIFCKLIFFLGLIILSPVNAQESWDHAGVGDILEIGHTDNYQYTHVKFPKPNFIIKKGGIANYEKLAGMLVEITSVKIDDKGNTSVLLKRKDGKSFFGSFPEIKADYLKAIASEELMK